MLLDTEFKKVPHVCYVEQSLRVVTLFGQLEGLRQLDSDRSIMDGVESVDEDASAQFLSFVAALQAKMHTAGDLDRTSSYCTNGVADCIEETV